VGLISHVSLPEALPILGLSSHVRYLIIGSRKDAVVGRGKAKTSKLRHYSNSRSGRPRGKDSVEKRIAFYWGESGREQS